MKKILLIEDNNDILENLTEFLTMEGFQVFTSNCGERGINLARECISDLIICDILMPEMDGYEVLHLLLSVVKTHEIPFIFSTAKSEKNEKAEALIAGADDFIVKPYDLEILLKMANKWIKSGSKRPHEVQD